MKGTLTLPLKKKWFDMIASGEKKEEYRAITPYWVRRLLSCGNTCGGLSFNGEVLCPACKFLIFKRIHTVTFTLGYPKSDDTSRRMSFAVEGIYFGEGKQEWGAEEETQYFVIKLGRKL